MSKNPRQAAIDFLRPGGVFITGSQARFNMSYRNIGIKRGQTGSKGCGGITLHQYQIWTPLIVKIAHPAQNTRRQVRQVLVRLHQVKIKIWFDSEEAKHLIEHMAVLRGHAHLGLSQARFTQLVDDRRHFDGFRPGSERNEDPLQLQKDQPF